MVSARAIVMQFGGADVDTQAAEDAEVRVEHDVVEATEAPKRLERGLLRAVPDLDFGEAHSTFAWRRGDRLALDGVVARRQSAEGGATRQFDMYRGAARLTCRKTRMDGRGGSLPVSDRVDEVSWAVRDVASRPDSRVRSLQRDGVDLDAAAAER